MKRLGQLFSFIIAVTVLLMLSSPAYAMDFRSAPNVLVPKGTTLNGMLVAAGTSVIIDGTVRGDVLCAGQEVTVRGTVDGDLMCAGQNVTVDGVVTGNIHAAGQTVSLDRTIGKNALLFGQNVAIREEAKIPGDLLFAAQHLVIDGTVGRDIGGAGESIAINGQIGRDITVADQTLRFGPDAQVAGGVTYVSPALLTADPTTVIHGVIRHELPKKEASVRKDLPFLAGTARAAAPFRAISGILIALGMGILLVIFFPVQTDSVTDRMTKEPGRTLLTGLLLLVITPVALVFLMLTIIGIPISLLLVLLFAAAVAVSRLFVAYLVGKKLIFASGNPEAPPVLRMIVGVPVVWIAFNIPLIGFFLTPLAVMWGLGGMLSSARHLSPRSGRKGK